MGFGHTNFRQIHTAICLSAKRAWHGLSTQETRGKDGQSCKDDCAHTTYNNHNAVYVYDSILIYA